MSSPNVIDTSSDSTAHEPTRPLQLAFSLPSSPDTKIHFQLTNLSSSLVLHVATLTPAGTSGSVPLSSFVYALPDRLNPEGQPLSTPLYTKTSSVDFVTRLARILARRLKKPVYVGGESKFWDQEDEASGLKGIVDAVMEALR